MDAGSAIREELRVEHGLCVSRGEQVVKLDGELQEAVARNKGLEDALAAAVRDLERTESSRIAGALTGLLGEVRVLRDDNAKLSKMMRAFAKAVGKPRKAKPKKARA